MPPEITSRVLHHSLELALSSINIMIKKMIDLEVEDEKIVEICLDGNLLNQEGLDTLKTGDKTNWEEFGHKILHSYIKMACYGLKKEKDISTSSLQ